MEYHPQRLAGAAVVPAAGQTGSKRLWPSTIAAPMARHARGPRYCAPASATILAPIAQMTCRPTYVRPPSSAMPIGANDAAVEMTRTSTTISHRPRSTRNRARSDGLLRCAIRPALTPARNTNVGAQKWVIHRVANSSGSGRRIRRRILHRTEHHVVTNVIESHHDDHEPAEYVDRRHSVRAPIGRRSGSHCNSIHRQSQYSGSASIGRSGFGRWPWRQIARDTVQPHCVGGLKEIEAARGCE